MGVTVIQKSTPRTRKVSPRVALVLAGGAVTAGAFELGGLAALDSMLVGRKVTDLDIFVGLSAGALLAAPLAAGISPEEMLEAHDRPGELGQLSVLDLYFPNLEEFLGRPLELLSALVGWLPRVGANALARLPEAATRLRQPFEAWLAEPGPETLTRLTSAVADSLLAGSPPLPMPLDYLPSGLFDNRRIERFVRRSFTERGIANSFRALLLERGRELYISAVDLDTAERVVFGHDEDSALLISEAVQASTALPGFYRPARIKGVDYVDGSVRRTANIDVAIEHGADLVICYNPFRPYNNSTRPGAADRHASGAPLAEHGLVAVMSQVFRALLHSRLHLGLNQYREDPSFHGDIVLIEPSDTEESFLNAFPFWPGERQRAAEVGARSLEAALEADHDTVAEVFHRYGLTLARPPGAAGSAAPGQRRSA